MNNTSIQDEALAKLNKLKVGALFMEMGTGKTKVALDLINYKFNKVDNVIWICPCSIKNDIKEEIIKWYPKFEKEILIIGIETISQSDRKYLEIYNLMKDKRNFLVVDESIKIKNNEAKRTRRLNELGRMAEYKLILNGTPTSKNLLDLWSQMNFLSPKILKMDYNQFKNTFCEYYIRGRLKGLVKKTYNIPYLISLISPYIFDAKLEIEANKVYLDYYYNLENTDEYENIKQYYLSKFSESNIDFFSLSQALQQCYCRSEERQLMINELISKSNDQFIIFVKFLSSIPNDAIAITGDKKEQEREQIESDFKAKKIKVLYITYGCGAYGLNLQCCHNVIFLDHTFDYSQQIQAEARVYRIGQEQEVTYYNFYCNTGLENMIRMSLDKKSNLLLELKKEIEKKGENECLKIM